MPTPIAHGLGAIAAGSLVAAASSRALRRTGSRCGFEAAVARLGPRLGLAGVAGVGVLPDIDLLFGMHRGVTHSLGATLLVAAIGAAVAPGARLPAALTTAAAFASHMCLDWLGTDPSPPHGIMALWPWTTEFYLSDAQLFMRICREHWMLECWRHNFLAVCRELAMLGPVTLAALLVARRSLRAEKAAMGPAGR